MIQYAALLCYRYRNLKITKNVKQKCIISNGLNTSLALHLIMQGTSVKQVKVQKIELISLIRLDVASLLKGLKRG